ncbi:efflux RND transporter permease subunit [Natronoglomus mannanivorans]|uniref:MMPL family transporter n=1 Tax=Natronoglomus mannanivorans TaxID=2979990 RepID=A0AAP3E311_9EURY|nr:MMPL family transporter [Halobacteria archaeon AArc-xg1-1]
MTEGLADRYADTIVSRSRLVIVCLLLVTLVVGAGAIVGDNEEGEIGQFETDSPETEALEEIEATYGTDDTLVTQIVVRDERGEGGDSGDETGDVLTRESLLESLALQQDVRDDETLNATVDSFVGIENVVATGAVFEDRAAAADGPPDTDTPTLEEQIEALESRSDTEVEALLAAVLDPDADFQGSDEDPTEFLPTDYEPGSTTADARITFLFQVDDSGPDEDPQAAYDAQVEIASLVDDRFGDANPELEGDAFVFGQGITDAASSSAVGDSFAIITPVALVLILFVFAVTYRDVVDVLVGLFGIAVVMAWLAGILGWLEIPTSQLLIAVPFLLIGLSIDYSLHVVMRFREAREGTLEDDSRGPDSDSDSDSDFQSEPGTASITTDTDSRDVRGGMRLGLASVVLALAAATFSTGVGFLSNVVSPLPAIQDFAVLCAGGIVATFIVFGALVPAVKVEIDDLLENRFGRDRRLPPFGGAGVVNRVLSGGAALVRRIPLAVVVVAFLLAAGGAYGATGIDTEFNQADFLPEDAPEWAKSLPGPFAPDTYTISDDVAYLGENFQERGEGTQTQILLRGDVTDPATLVALEDAAGSVDSNGTITSRADGDPAIESPRSVLLSVAAENDTVAAALEERDTSGNDLPDEDLAGLYDVLFDADSEAASEVLYRTAPSDYESARLLVSVRGDAAAQDVADDSRTLADAIESGAPITAVATGGPVVTAVVQDALLETLVQAFAVTLVVILTFLTILYWRRYRAPSLGAITLAPVVAALCWLLGTMAVLEIPFNSETAVITSLAIGLGVDYSIHVSERFLSERERTTDLETALTATVTGTGGALLGSAATTTAGFGVLALALAPPLQRFGLVTGLSIVFAFVACLTVLPCLLVLRERLSRRAGTEMETA